MLYPNILIVDDEEGMRFFLAEAMKKEGYSFTTASSGEEAIELYEKEPFPIAVLDIKMPGISGIETFEKIKRINPDVIVILITAHGLKNIPMELFDRGIYDYFTKPFDIKELRVVIKRAIERWKLKMEVTELHANLEDKYRYKGIIGASHKIRDIFTLIEKVKDVDVNVLITGESGTGKELVAKTIHYLGSRRACPFVEVGCMAIPDSLLEAELFGFEKGAFTGAYKQKIGRIEVANRGTLFLDEAGDLSLSTQTKLLRVLQEKTFSRVGGTMPVKVDFRLITATNKELTKEIKDGRFREDLYYRLNVVSIALPPLRERKDDIPLLINHFLDKYNILFKKNIIGLSHDAMVLFMDYNWPGNIRELENAIQRGLVLTESGSIDRNIAAEALGTTFIDAADVSEETEKEIITDALNKKRWKKGEAASILRISRKSLYNKMKKYGLLENNMA